MNHPIRQRSCILFLSSVLVAGAASPVAPSGLKVVPLGTDAQILAWQDNSADETQFRIERLDGPTWQPAGNASANISRLVLHSQPAGSQTYRIFAVNGDGDSDASPMASTLRMNVLFFLADDMGYKDIVANRNPATDGPTIYETPALDTLVSQGVSFTNAYCSGPKCVVARRALQTGMYDYRATAVAKNGGIGPEMVTVGEAMQAGGYRTCFIGKWHLGGTLNGSTSGSDEDFSSGGLVPHQPLSYTDWALLPDTDPKYIPATDPNHDEGNKVPATQGYDVAIATGEWGAPPISYFANAPTGVEGEYWYGLPDLYSTDPTQYLTDRLTTEATGFVGNHIANHPTQPFFLTLAHYAVHTPLEAKADRIAYYEAKRTAMASAFAAHPAGAGEQVDLTSKVRMFQDQPIYAAMMESFDQSLAAIRSYLASTNDPRNPGMTLADTTLIVLSSDHGGKSTHWINSPDSTPIPTSNYPLRQGKTWVYEGGLKIPLVVYWPGINGADLDSSAFVNGADFYTTILDMTGTARVPSQHLDSISFAECMVDQTKKPRVENAHWFTNADTGTGNPALGAYRSGDYKLVYQMIRRTPELYDLAEDVGEHNDISSLRPDLVSEFLARLISVRNSVDARQPLPTSNSWTKELEVIAPVTAIPANVPNGAPSNLAGTVVSDTSIDLTWTDGSTDEERFVIQRKFLGSGAFLEIATVPANVTRFRDTGLVPGTSYQYRIQAENLRGWNGPSNQITVVSSSSAVLPIIARGDDITTLKNEAREFVPLVNDQGKGLSLVSISQPSLGTASIQAGAIRFIPTPNATGTDTMTYTVADSNGAHATGTVMLTILPDHTVTPPLVYDLSPIKTNVDVWEFNDANGITIASAAKTAGTSVFTGTTPTVQSGALRFAQGGTSASIFRNATIASGAYTLGNSNSPVMEMSFRITNADLSGGANNAASPAYVGIGTRGKDAANAASDPLQIRLQESGANLILQVRGASISTCRTFTGLVLSQPLEVRAVMDLYQKSATVYSKLGSESEVNHGTYAFTTGTVMWDTYRLSSLNNNTDWGATDFVDVDWLRFKSLIYPAPPNDFQRWIDTADGSTTPSVDKLPLADADNDGVKNLLEYAYGGHPFDPSSRIMQHVGNSGGSGAADFVFTLPVIPGSNFSQQGGLLTTTVNGLRCHILGSTDLVNFDAAIEEVFPSLDSGLLPAPRGWEYRTFRFAVPPGSTAAFMKAAVEQDP